MRCGGRIWSAGESRMPDETTILNFRHLLAAHQLAESLFQEVVSLLTDQGLILREGTIVDATLISASIRSGFSSASSVYEGAVSRIVQE